MFANLGIEGSGLATRQAQTPYNVFANLGIEGSGLAAAPAPPVAAVPRPWAN